MSVAGLGLLSISRPSSTTCCRSTTRRSSSSTTPSISASRGAAPPSGSYSSATSPVGAGIGGGARPRRHVFQFDRQRLASVQRRWIREVFRLDPTVRTVRDIEAKYNSQIESSFGDLGPDSSLRIRSGRRSPVVVATILLVVGWLLAISTTQVPELVPDATGELVWSSSPPDVFPVASFFRPDLTLVGYAFLGSYVFTLYHVIHGYQRRDLHPKTYNTVVVRILSAYALALVVSVVYKGPAAEVMLFFVGFTPQTVLVWLREKLGDDHGIFEITAARTRPPHESRGDRSLRSNTAGRRRRQQCGGSCSCRHRRPHEQHEDLRRPTRRLDRPGDPLPPRRWRRPRPDMSGRRAGGSSVEPTRPHGQATGRQRPTRPPASRATPGQPQVMGRRRSRRRTRGSAVPT